MSHRSEGQSTARALLSPYLQSPSSANPYFNDLYTLRNGIEVPLYADRRAAPFKYEDRCFKQIILREGKKPSLFLGPHLLDRVLGKEMPNLSRPDAIRFDLSVPEIWTITDLYEFKSGKNIARKYKSLQTRIYK